MGETQILLDKIQYLIENNTSFTIGINELKNIWNDLSLIQINQQSEINRLKEEYEQKRKTEHDYLKAANEDLKKEINRLKEDKKQIIALIKTELENDISNDFSTAYFEGLEKALDIILSQNKH